MADIESLYKKENGRILIEIKLSSVMQLFNSFDPAPFHEKELDTAAEHYIVDTVKDFPKKTRFKIIIYLPPDIASTERAQKIRRQSTTISSTKCWFRTGNSACGSGTAGSPCLSGLHSFALPCLPPGSLSDQQPSVRPDLC